MSLVMYVGPLMEDEINGNGSMSILFLAPLVEDLVKHYINIMAESGVVVPKNNSVYDLRIEFIERLLDVYPHVSIPEICKGFALPSFFELAERIHYQDKILLSEPNMVSALVFLTRNIVQRFCESKPLAILISDTTLYKLGEAGEALYSYKDMFIIESYGYVAEACDTVLIIYVKNVRSMSKIIEKILLESPNLILSVDLMEVASQGIPLSILELHKSKSLNIKFAVALELNEKSIGEKEKNALEKLYNLYDGKLGMVLKNAKPLIPKPIKVSKDTLNRYVHNIIANLSA